MMNGLKLVDISLWQAKYCMFMQSHIKCSTRVKGQDVNMISIMAPEAKRELC